MTALCHAEFALSEADYFLGALHSEEKAVDGLRRLARRPRAMVPQRAGRKLLDALRRRAGRKDLLHVARPEKEAAQP
jgi:hypothetical protein